ncbi:FAD-dependent thymidylate synthase [Bryobacter aggregatus]|uniref:FAD-dependent thymidylate synthase n=1 Tax=Bryobacter aggregatus TaxID=360054 RepID=UPI001EE1737F|nr:FAD-dependent thymidylate synthase [Bryobacter aggregatus]
MSPMPAEKSAYALARYSRSADSIVESLEWVRTHNSQKFLESFYFQYGHASIADLGHLGICWEGVSELAATEIEDEQLWDGQAKSTRYQDFSKLGFVTPPDLSTSDARRYQEAGRALLAAYEQLHALKFAELTASLPRPADMKPDAYERNLKARAFDVARYVLFFGIPTNVGQVTSIRTLEKQIRRLKASEFAEIREVAGEAAAAVAAPPGCVWDASVGEPVAPTLAKYVDPEQHGPAAHRDLSLWAAQNLPAAAVSSCDAASVTLDCPRTPMADIVASLLYPVTTRPYRELYVWAEATSQAVRNEVIGVALGSRGRYDELLKQFRGGPYVFDIVMDIGAYRDLHRHRRCVQLRQAYTGELGYSVPGSFTAGPLRDIYRAAMDEALRVYRSLPQPAAQYLLPFGAHSRFLFKMDFAEVEYISRLRSGVKGHFSYREIAWKMKEELGRVEPDLAALIAATPPWEEDPLTR